MLKRALDPRFSQAVLDGRKFTTIRDQPWPVEIPIMLYNWAGAAYRSKQIDVTPVIVSGFWRIQITHRADATMLYAYGMENSKPLHETEGFESKSEMDDWFRPLVKPGQTLMKHLMRFCLANNEAHRPDRGPLANRKLVWLLQGGGTLVSDNGEEAVVLKNGSYCVIDVWGKVMWQEEAPSICD